MDKELSLQDIKGITLAVLIHFRDFCNENSIKFYLSNGTLLGAVKYGGFIPWDDDIDVLMPRKDYERFIELYKDSDKYKLFTRKRMSDYKFPYAKLCDMNTRKIECNINSGVDLGVDIDIFPLDSCSEHILNPSLQRKLSLSQKGCMLSKFISSEGKPVYKRLIIECCKFLGFEFFCKRLENIVKKEADKKCEYMGCLMWPIYGKREIIPAEAFRNTVEVEFEGEIFPAPYGYDTYLHSLYGDYKKDPPIEKQKTHHKYIAYRI